MDTPESQESGTKERPKPNKLVPITLNLSVSDHAAILDLTYRKIKHSGEHVPVDRIVSEAIQSYAKASGAKE